MKKKSIMAVMLTAILMVSSSAVAFAAQSEALVGTGWWAEGRSTSTAVTLEDGATVTFDIVMDAPTTDDTYAAFCVEVSDGTLFYTTTSAGDCWGYLDGVTEIGTVIKDTGKNDAVLGGSYEVVVTRDGSDFTVTYNDKSTGEPMFSTLYFMAKDEFTFADPITVYVIGQVGNGTVAVAEAAEEAPAEDTTATTTDVPKTGVVGLGLVYGLGAIVTGAVALKRKQK